MFYFSCNPKPFDVDLIFYELPSIALRESITYKYATINYEIKVWSPEIINYLNIIEKSPPYYEINTGYIFKKGTLLSENEDVIKTFFLAKTTVTINIRTQMNSEYICKTVLLMILYRSYYIIQI